MRPIRTLCIVLLCAFALLVVNGDVCASTLSPGHAIWESGGIDTGALARALQELRARQAKQPRGIHADPSDEFAAKNDSPERRFLVVPVLYADSPAEGPVSVAEIEARFFDLERGDSFASWWRRASAGAFVPRGRVLDWARLSGPRAQYQNVVNGRPRFSATRALAEEATCLVAPLLGEWWDYDDDGSDGLPGSGDDDGLIDFVIFLHPDPGIEIQVEDDGIVAVQDRMDQDTVWDDCEVGADPFVIASVFDPLGVWVHESGHLLGLVDLYDLDVPPTQTGDGRATGGLGLWSLMATGTWGADGRDPTDLDAYSRSLLGWNASTVVDTDAQIDLAVGADRAIATLLPAVDWGRERYVLEARSPENPDGIDGALPGEGVLIYRVDESAQDCRRPEALRLVELLQADGLEDLENLRNEGDAGDPYTGESGANQLSPLTDPASYPRSPGPEKLTPWIDILPGSASSGWRVLLSASTVPTPRLLEARFEGGTVALPYGFVQDWWPVFEFIGLPTDGARLRVLGAGPELWISSNDWLDLRENGDGHWVLADTLRMLTDVNQTAISSRIYFQVEENSMGAVLNLEMGIPLGDGGLAAERFGDWIVWEEAVGSPITSMTPLSPTELPGGTVQGWVVDADGPLAYGNCVDLSLVSPWIAPVDAADDALDFWSRFHTEEADPGEAWDGGIVEIQWPGRPWIPLEPEGRGIVRVRPLTPSQAGTAPNAGALGLGGGPETWSRYQASYEVEAMPYRLRMRFGSDVSVAPRDPLGAWGIADAMVAGTLVEDLLELLPASGDRMEARFVTANAAVDSVSLHWRRAPSSMWLPLAPAEAVDPDGEAHFEFRMPETAYFEVGAFSGSLPELLLARDGWRRSETRPLRAFPNPSSGLVNFLAAWSGSERELRIYDLRGRRVRALPFPANLTVVSWDGRDDAGRRVASGNYFARLSGGETSSASFIIVR